jgi:phosphoglycolate phosphatase-like HAD superfamily hydrolase
VSARAVILDVDGTLVDSNGAHARAWTDAFAEHGIAVAYERVLRSIGMGGDKLMPEVANVSEDSPLGERISTRRGEIFQAIYLPTVRAFPRARDLIQRFNDDGFTLAVASSAKEEELDPLLKRAGVRDLIQTKTSSDDAESSKPEPDIVAAALKKAKTAPRSAVMLGDTPYDVEAARRAGVAIVALECGGWTREELEGAAEVYADPADLLARYERSLFARAAAGSGRAPREPAESAAAKDPAGR